LETAELQLSNVKRTNNETAKDDNVKTLTDKIYLHCANRTDWK